MKGKLTALYQGQKEIKYIEAINSLDLTLIAIKHILNQAIDNQLWAKGKIILQDSEGNVLKEMAEK